MHTMLRNTRGISTLSLIILLIVSALLGAVLSYLWTVGYYVEMGFNVPEGTTITITNVTFPLEDSTHFNVTILNPSYSKADANITGIAIISTINDVETIYDVNPWTTEPSIPYPLNRGETVTFKCTRGWGEFAGQIIRVIVFLQDASGATFPYKTSIVELEIVEAQFDVATIIERFNVTIKNSAESSISLNLSRILFDYTVIPNQNITIQNENATLPQQLLPGQNKTFVCTWNLWKTGALGSPHTIIAQTLQGYSTSYETETLPQPVSLNITDVTFNASDVSGFNVTVSRLDSSSYNVNINRITITNGTQIFENVTIIGDTILGPNSTILIQCFWNWEAFKDQEVKITVYTTQGFYKEKLETFPNE